MTVFIVICIFDNGILVIENHTIVSSNNISMGFSGTLIGFRGTGVPVRYIEVHVTDTLMQTIIKMLNEIVNSISSKGSVLILIKLKEKEQLRHKELIALFQNTKTFTKTLNKLQDKGLIVKTLRKKGGGTEYRLTERGDIIVEHLLNMLQELGDSEVVETEMIITRRGGKIEKEKW